MVLARSFMLSHSQINIHTTNSTLIKLIRLIWTEKKISFNQFHQLNQCTI